MRTRKPPRARWHAGGEVAAARARFRESAYAMICSGSLATLSMRALAEQVGASAMTAYRYFPDKESLVEDVRQHVWHEFALVLTAAAGLTDDADVGFRDICAAYLDFAVQREHEYRLLFEASQPPATEESIRTAANNGAWRALNAAVERVTPDIGQQAIGRRAHLVWSSLHGLASLHLSGRLVFGTNLDALTRPLIAMLLASLHETRTNDGGAT